MAHLSDFVQLETVQGTAVPTPFGTVRPESQALTIRFPFGGFVWHRPTAVLVEEANQARRLPISDVTRQAVWSLLGAGLLLAWVLRLFKSSPNPKQ